MGLEKKHVASGFSVLEGSLSDVLVRVLASWDADSAAT